MRKAAPIAIVALVVSASGLACRESEPTHPLRVPRELADAAALAELTDWAGLPVFDRGVYRMQSSEDRNTEWSPTKAIWDNGNRDFNNFVCRGAETDAPPAEVPYEVDLDACPEPYVRGMVMARFEGSGRLARIWMTAASIRSAPPDDEIVRIYIDDDPVPRVQAPLAEMLAGGGHEVFAPPFGAGSRRYLAWHYPVVFADKLIVSLDGLGQRDLYFHQTSVVLDGEERRSPALRLPEREAAKRFLSADVPRSGRATRLAIQLEPQRSHTFELRGPATLVRLSASRAEGVRLRVRWDDDLEPAIDLPVDDLFARWLADPARPSLALAAGTLRLPMPFAKRARFELVNETDRSVAMELTYERADGVPAAAWGHLHVQRYVTTAPASAKVHPLAKADGRGRLVGTCMSMQGHGLVERGRRGHPFHFLEGDELGFIDGERVLAGTGTEDYFDGAFYFEDGPIGTPFSQVWDIAARDGRVSTCRWHVLGDEIDFRRSIDLSLEIGPGVPEVLDAYRSVSFLYR